MRKMEVKAGDWVIKQGAKGDRFYVVDQGSFEVRVNYDAESVTDEKDAGEFFLFFYLPFFINTVN